EVIGQAQARPLRAAGQTIEFEVPTRDGETLFIQLPRPHRRVPLTRAPWWKPLDFAWLLTLVALAVALGAYPVVRRLTKRLEALQQGVNRWGDGDLSLRLPVDGRDEVAFLAQRFNIAAERVEALLTSHKSLLANASHELRSPLTRIRMGLELMGGQPSAELRQEIARNIHELDLLIDEILLASRLDANPADVGRFEAVDLVGLCAEECARSGAELVLDPPTSQLLVSGISRLLRRLLRNLLDNATRHAPGAHVQLTLSSRGTHARIQVCDAGPGVPPAYRERIFEPFFRLPGSSESDGGAGLGLSLARSIALRHGGSIRCDERPGGGSCFAIVLPRLDAPAD
ncbi:MAG: HAMP domain-containing histidine kinase, partial [Hylemonella sp.]|nr:HAMP domain-containing histidine kinase [Hylemonella sp.]